MIMARMRRVFKIIHNQYVETVVAWQKQSKCWQGRQSERLWNSIQMVMFKPEAVVEPASYAPAADCVRHLVRVGDHDCDYSDDDGGGGDDDGDGDQ